MSENQKGYQSPAPKPDSGFWKNVWLVVKTIQARLRFVAVLVVIGLVIGYWDTFKAYYERWTASFAKEAPVASSDVEYYCSMHPQVVRDNPKEKCPICGMALTRREKKEPETLPAGTVSRVQLSPYRIILADVHTSEVAYLPLVKELTTVGFFEFDERKQFHIAARVGGWIEKLYANETGKAVVEGEDLALIYSPDLVIIVQNLINADRSENKELQDSARNRLRLLGIGSAQVEMIVAVQNLLDGQRGGKKDLLERARRQFTKLEHGAELEAALLQLLDGQGRADKPLIEKARIELGRLGLDDDQIDDVLATGRINRRLKIRSPIDGHIIRKFQVQGKNIKEGDPLYDVADLATVWIQAQVYEDDLVYIQEGQPVSATSPAFPNRQFTGKIGFIHPHVDRNSRTITVRFNIDNPGHEPLPGMDATVKLEVPASRVPALSQALMEHWKNKLTADVFSLGRPGHLDRMKLTGLDTLTQSAIQQVLLQRGYFLAVPESAVIDTGTRKIVYRQSGAATFDGVEVQLGPRFGPFYPVLSGLELGDRIVTTGSFLVDAETRLNPAAGSIYFGGRGGLKEMPNSGRPSVTSDPEAEIRASRAKLSPEDLRLVKAQELCPVQSDNRLGSMGKPVKLMIKGQPVFLCCKNCEEEALAHPEETLAKVRELKAKRAER